MELTIKIMELIGTVAFALAGTMVAMRKNMDIMGINILALTTAVGGGVLRDVILGLNPPMVFRDPTYVVISIVSATLFAIILNAYRKSKMPFHKMALPQAFYEKLFTVLDAVGLGAFSVIGVGVAMNHYDSPSFILLLFVGMATGAGGGIMRDTMAQDTPAVFVRHIYGSASLAGSAVCALLWNTVPHMTAMLVGAAAVVIIRLLSSHFKWNLPRFSM